MSKGGRPTSYDQDIIDKAYDYLENYETEYDDRVPMVVGLCKAINRARSTVYKWADEEGKEEFSDILCQIEEMQHLGLVNKGLAGEFNPAITKMMLTKHGYSDKQDTTVSAPGSGPVENKWVVEFINADPQGK